MNSDSRSILLCSFGGPSGRTDYYMVDRWFRFWFIEFNIPLFSTSFNPDDRYPRFRIIIP